MNEDDFERGRMAWYEKMRGLDDDGDEPEDDDQEELGETLCDFCNGTGEGLTSPDMKCQECFGSGVLK